MSFGLLTFRIVTIVFLFLMRLRFPAQDSIITILRGDRVMFWLRKFGNFKRLDFKYRKTTPNLDLLQSYKKKHLIPKFLQFKVANKRLG